MNLIHVINMSITIKFSIVNYKVINICKQTINYNCNIVLYNSIYYKCK